MARPSLLKLTEVDKRQLREAAAESPQADFRDACRAVLSLARGVTRQQVPMQMDFNDQYGDCTCACLGNVLDVIKRILKYTGGAIPDAQVLAWAKANGFQDGATFPTSWPHCKPIR